MKRSIEHLSHFQCDCGKWFSIGDAPLDQEHWYCPWCGKHSGSMALNQIQALIPDIQEQCLGDLTVPELDTLITTLPKIIEGLTMAMNELRRRFDDINE